MTNNVVPANVLGTNLSSLNRYPFTASKSVDEFEIEIVGDASDRGLFAFSYGETLTTLGRRMFTVKEAEESSTYREILVLHKVYCSAEVDRFSNRRIRHLTDNLAVEWIFKSGARNPKI